MGLKADLAVELKVALAEGTSPVAMGEWLQRNAETVMQALDWADDLVEIEEIRLSDLPLLVKDLKPA